MEGMEDIELSIVMPCLNEAETLEICVRKANGYLARAGISGEVVIGDNGSTDGSQEIARRTGARVVDIAVKGYGAALYGACMAARGRWIVMGDSDDSYDFENLDPFVERLREGDDLVMGNRFAGGIAKGAMPWKNRYLGNPVLSGIGKLLFRSKLKDFHCGLRGFSKAAFERMDMRTTGMEFASEMVIKASLLEMRVSEAPTVLRPDGRSRPPHLRPWRDGWRHLRFMLLFSPNWLFLYPGLALMGVCLVMGALIVPGPMAVGGIHLDVDTLIYCSIGLLMGFQAALFAFLSRVYAVQQRLYPEPRRFRQLFRVVTLERGLIAGAVVAVAGVVGAVYSVLEWKRQAFGELNLAQTARIVIPSATAMALGIEIILFSFFLSTLGLSMRQGEVASRESASA
jgi:glycosyltransferase involved in cell wall biosynthesis